MPRTSTAHAIAVEFSADLPQIESSEYRKQARSQLFEISSMLGQSVFLTAKYRMISTERALLSASSLEPGWDSYGAPPPNDLAVTNLRRLLQELASHLVLPTAIVPSAQGGIAAYFKNETDRTAYIESPNAGQPLLVTYDNTGAATVLEIGTDIDAADIGTRIATHLDRL